MLAKFRAALAKTLFSIVQRKSKKKKGVIPKEFIKQFLPEDPIVVEAGAHVGTDTVEMAEIWPAGSIHAFEPVHRLYLKLQENTAGLSNVSCYPCALAGSTTTRNMFISSGGSDASSSLLPPKDHLDFHPDVLFTEQIEIDTISLDQWAAENHIRQVDFLWLDLQGYELEVLQAGAQILQRVSVIHSEVHLVESYEAASLYPRLRAWLKKSGFVVVREEIPWRDGGNVLFVRDTDI